MTTLADRLENHILRAHAKTLAALSHTTDRRAQDDLLEILNILAGAPKVPPPPPLPSEVDTYHIGARP